MNISHRLQIGPMLFDFRNLASKPKLARAVVKNDIDLVKKILLDYNFGFSCINAVDNRGYTALHDSASHEKYLEIAKLLLESHAYVDHVTVENETPLHIACYFSNHKMVKLLIEYNCDVDKKTTSNYTPLFIACAKNDTNIAEQLIRAGADVNSRDLDFRTPIFAAIEAKSVQVVKLLLTKGVYKTAVDIENRTILRYACIHYNSEILDIIIKHCGSSYGFINYRSEDGWTALMDAIQSKHIQAIETLLKHGADINLPDNRLILPLHIAAHTGDMNIFKMILNLTNRGLVEKFCVKLDGNKSMRSLPCLLIDVEMYEGLELLLSLNYSLDVYTCPVVIDSYAYSPICFLLAKCSRSSSFKLKVFNILLPKEELTEQFYKSTNGSLSLLHAVSIMHNSPVRTQILLDDIDIYPISEPHNSFIFTNCICLKLIKILLEKGVDPDGDYLITKKMPSLFVKMVNQGFIEGLKLVLRYTSIDPEDIARVYFNTVHEGLQKNKDLFNIHVLEMTEFLLKICTDFTTEYELVYKNIKPKSFTGTRNVRDITKMYNMVKNERKVHTLYQIARTAVRKHLKNNGDPINLVKKIELLEIPNSTKLFLRFYDLAELE